MKKKMLCLLVLTVFLLSGCGLFNRENTKSSSNQSTLSSRDKEISKQMDKILSSNFSTVQGEMSKYKGGFDPVLSSKTNINFILILIKFQENLTKIEINRIVNLATINLYRSTGYYIPLKFQDSKGEAITDNYEWKDVLARENPDSIIENTVYPNSYKPKKAESNSEKELSNYLNDSSETSESLDIYETSDSSSQSSKAIGSTSSSSYEETNNSSEVQSEDTNVEANLADYIIQDYSIKGPDSVAGSFALMKDRSIPKGFVTVSNDTASVETNGEAVPSTHTIDINFVIRNTSDKPLVIDLSKFTLISPTVNLPSEVTSPYNIVLEPTTAAIVGKAFTNVNDQSLVEGWTISYDDPSNVVVTAPSGTAGFTGTLKLTPP